MLLCNRVQLIIARTLGPTFNEEPTDVLVLGRQEHGVAAVRVHEHVGGIVPDPARRELYAQSVARGFKVLLGVLAGVEA